MAAKIISGTEIAKAIREELKQEVEGLIEKHGVTPGLVTILVGEDPASMSYVTAKQKTSKNLGFHSIQDSQPADISEEDVLALVHLGEVAYLADDKVGKACRVPVRSLCRCAPDGQDDR